MSLRIRTVRAYPVSFPVPEDQQVSLGIGRTVKRDAVIVQVDTEGGITGWGEAHAARAPTAIAELINTTLAQLVTGLDAGDTAGVWERVYRRQLASHGAGAAAVIGLSGIDLALWDIKGKVAGKPICNLLGAPPRAIPAYAGGIALGFQDPDALADEACTFVEAGYRAIKLRLGDTPSRDIARVSAVRRAVGEHIDVLADANTNYTLDDFEAVADALIAERVGWLEEPFPAHDFSNYRAANRPGLILAAGENHYTRFDFERAADDGVLRVWQPDLSKTGGLTEGFRIATLAAEHDIRIHPHTSVTTLNMAASLHFLAVIENGGYYEADCSTHNPLRDALGGEQLVGDTPGFFSAPEAPGLGVEFDIGLLEQFPVITGGGYV